MDIQLYKDHMYQIIGAAMSLYNELGSGYSEPIYQECLSVICTLINFGKDRLHAEKYMYNDLFNNFELIRG